LVNSSDGNVSQAAQEHLSRFNSMRAEGGASGINLDDEVKKLDLRDAQLAAATGSSAAPTIAPSPSAGGVSSAATPTLSVDHSGVDSVGGSTVPSSVSGNYSGENKSAGGLILPDKK